MCGCAICSICRWKTQFIFDKLWKNIFARNSAFQLKNLVYRKKIDKFSLSEIIWVYRLYWAFGLPRKVPESHTKRGPPIWRCEIWKACIKVTFLLSLTPTESNHAVGKCDWFHLSFINFSFIPPKPEINVHNSYEREKRAENWSLETFLGQK